MDTTQPLFAFTGMDPLPVADDDDEIVTVGGPIWGVTKAEAIAPLTLAVEFEDGLTGTVRFEQSYLRGAFARLADPSYFAQVGAPHGAVSWPNEEPDMAPDTMYEAIALNGGQWVLR